MKLLKKILWFSLGFAFAIELMVIISPQPMTGSQMYWMGYKAAIRDLYYGEDPEMTDDLTPMKGMDI
jgi:hypothetical protein